MPQLANDLRNCDSRRRSQTTATWSSAARPAARLVTATLTAHGLEKAAKRAGLKGVAFHMLRHTFASILIAKGHDLSGR
jgi:site-specific recombinase XerD